MPHPSPNPHTERAPLLMVGACLAAVYIVWGTTYLAIKIGLEEVGPFFLLGTRLLVAGGGLLTGTESVRRAPSHRQAMDQRRLAGISLAGGGHRLRERRGAEGELWSRRRTHQHSAAGHCLLGDGIRSQAAAARMGRDLHWRCRHRRDGDGSGLSGQPRRYGGAPVRRRELEFRGQSRRASGRSPRRHGIRGRNAAWRRDRDDRQRRVRGAM